MPRRGRSCRLSPRAEADLEEIWLYTFRHWSAAQADSYLDGIVATFDDLAAGRKAGRPADVRAGYLKCPAGAHVVFYRQTEAGIDVIRVLHQSMDAARHL